MDPGAPTSTVPPAESPPPSFGSSYAKARKAYGLSSALLLAWELVGIEIEPSPIETLKISLKSPQAAPYVLIVLVIYFAFHFTIEWYQTAEARRRLWPSRFDFGVAHLIGTAAIGLYLAQTFLQIQVANTLDAFTLGTSAGFGFFLLYLVHLIRQLTLTFSETWRAAALLIAALILLVVVIAGALVLFRQTIVDNLIRFVVGFIAVALPLTVFAWFTRKPPP